MKPDMMHLSKSKIMVTASLAIVLAGCGGSTTTTQGSASAPTTEGDQATVVNVVVTDTASGQTVESDLTTFKVGVPYHFIVENTGDRTHELMIIQPIEPGTMDMEEMDAMALHVIEEDDLTPGSTAEFDYTFGADEVGKPLELACYLEGHYEAGMHAGITVEP